MVAQKKSDVSVRTSGIAIPRNDPSVVKFSNTLISAHTIGQNTSRDRKNLPQ